jgi:hypothetical protein
VREKRTAREGWDAKWANTLTEFGAPGSHTHRSSHYCRHGGRNGRRRFSNGRGITVPRFLITMSFFLTCLSGRAPIFSCDELHEYASPSEAASHSSYRPSFSSDPASCCLFPFNLSCACLVLRRTRSPSRKNRGFPVGKILFETFSLWCIYSLGRQFTPERLQQHAESEQRFKNFVGFMNSDRHTQSLVFLARTRDPSHYRQGSQYHGWKSRVRVLMAGVHNLDFIWFIRI